MTTQPAWLAALRSLVADDQLETQQPRLGAHAVDGRVPGAVVFPQTAEEVAAILQWAQREKLAVVPRGSGTKIRWGGVPTRLDVVLSTSRLTQISEYDVANFTITAGAGMTCAQVTQLTAAHMQILPLQYPLSAATLGGVIAANAYNPKRLTYGGVRDLLLGMRIALPSGEIAHFGGKVVKNVAGYDMCKLFIGSLGALGVVVEATFKLYASPERDETLLAVFPSLGRAAAALAQLTGTQLLPSQQLLLNPTAAQAAIPQLMTPVTPGGTLLVANCEGLNEAVARQLTDLAQICHSHGASSVQMLAGDAQLRLRQRLEAATQDPEADILSSPRRPSPLAAQGVSGGAVVVRLGTLPAQVPMVIEALTQTLSALASEPMIVGDCGVGSVKLCIGREAAAAGMLDGTLPRALRELSRLVAADGGYAVVESAAPAVKAEIEIWGPSPSSFVLLKALKRTFDPEAILSPGRFIGGL